MAGRANARSCAATVAALLFLSAPLHARQFSTLHSFAGAPNDGNEPYTGLIAAGPSGGFYGTTLMGGSANDGTIFRMSRDGTTAVLYSFGGAPNDGKFPQGALTEDAGKNLYGATEEGGKYDHGTIFRLAPDGTETVLYSFKSGRDGAWPVGIAADSAGNFYGATFLGGGTGCDSGQGCGTVFRLAKDGRETLLHVFADGDDGSYPIAGPFLDKSGNLYGTASRGGGTDDGGTVFRISAKGKFATVHSFSGSDGLAPFGGLIQDAAGNLYGTTAAGGTFGSGVVFSLNGDGSQTVLHDFGAANDGWLPTGNLTFDGSGNLYGTTVYGGQTSTDGCHRGGCGTVYELAPDGHETVLHAFLNEGDGRYPEYAAAIVVAKGDLYGTASEAGAHKLGTVFRIR